jgi:membrane protease YdiL (CAAX protease family)
VLTITAAGVLYAWLWDRTHSVWPVTIAHTFANMTFDWGFAAFASTTPVSLAFVAGETGVATFVAVVALAVVLLKTAKVWKTTPVPVDATSREVATRQIVGAR